MNAIRNIPLPPPALQAIGLLEQAGYETWCVGGYVRDALLGMPGGDIDLASSAPWEETAALFRRAGKAVHETGTAYGTVTAIVGSTPLEITTFRSDGAYRDARHPESVSFVSSIDADLARRDFTVNAIAYHPERGLRDPYRGVEDLQAGLIRAVGDAGRRFSEDALRILRGVRFASQLGFSLEEGTFEAMEANAFRMRGVAVERVFAELDKLMLGPCAGAALLSCERILEPVLPELAPMAACPQNTPYHVYGVLEHTAHVVDGSPRAPLSRWAALFHDAGKPASRTVDAAGRDHFKGHAQAGEAIAREALIRLKAPSRLVDDVCFLVGAHEWYTGSDERAVRRALRKMGGRAELYRALLDLQVADSGAKAPGVTERLEAARSARACLEDVLERDLPFSLAQLAIGGRELIADGWMPGPQLGCMLDELLELVVDGRLENRSDALLAYARTHRFR